MKKKKVTHIWRRWGTSHIFFLAFTDELKKNYLFKKQLTWVNKKQNKFNICYTLFKKKKKKKKRKIWDTFILNLCSKNLDDMIYSSWENEHDQLKLVILGHFLPFYSPKTPQKNHKSFLKKMKTITEDIIILLMCTKNHNIWCTVPEIRSETKFYHFMPFFDLLPY